MSGVLEFFYEDVSEANTSCSKEHEELTSNLIININFLQNCDGIGIVFNKGTFFISIAIIVMFYQQCQFIQPFKKWVPQSTLLMMIGFVIGLITNVSKGDETGELELEHSPLYISTDWLKFAYLPMVMLNTSYSLYHLQFFR